MSLQTLMQAGSTKADELFAKLAETSDGAVKIRDKLFSQLKAELEPHIGRDERRLFPVPRRNAKTKERVAKAIKDNKGFRAKLAEFEALPKNNEAFPERLKDLQKTFRQHVRDDKRELLPAVQQALSEEQVQNVVEKIEADVAEADKARQDEVEARRLQARLEPEEAERQAGQRTVRTAQATRADLPPQLGALSDRAQYLPTAVRDALRAILSVAAHNATPEQVLGDTFARLGYLPEETKQMTRKILA